MSPFLLKRFAEDCWTVRGVCDCYVTMYIVGLILYLLMPYDIIPEAVYGFLGMLDDIFVVLLFLVPITRAIYQGYARRNSAEANPEAGVAIEMPAMESVAVENLQVAAQPPVPEQ